MGIGDIIGNHKPASTNKEEDKAIKDKTEEIVKELVPEPPKAPRGRPRKNSTDKPPPKTPPRSSDILFPPDAPPVASSAAKVADEIANKAMIRRLSVYCKRFPQFSPAPGSYNPYVHSAAENKLVVDAIKEAVRAEVEFLTAPALISDTIRNSEGMALAWALTNPEHPAAPHLMGLHTAANAVLSDPAVDLDIGLLECELTGYMPESPTLRLLINVVRVLSKVWTENKVNTVVPRQHSGKEDNFKEF